MFSHQEARSSSVAAVSSDEEGQRDFEIYEGPLRNPERGLMQAIDIFKPEDVLFVQSQGVSLGISQINLARFRSQALSEGFLRDMRRGFANVREAGLKVVLRFEYDTHGGKDAPLERILDHIDQLAPLLEENADVIVVVQAGFVGAWGEWHSSQHGLDSAKSRHAILQRLLEVVPESRKIQVRSPVFKEQALQYAAAHGESALAGHRIGYHNDCLQADDTDQGTYPAPSEKWRDYVVGDRPDLPVGGETCKQNVPRTNCGHAIYQLRRQRWSFVNRTYHPDVIASWQEQGCLNLIDRDLGYRFALKSYDLPTTLRAGGTATLAVELENLGYAVPFNERPVFAVFSGPEGRFEIFLEGWDPRTWEPDGVRELQATLRIPEDVTPGSYSVALWFPDPQPLVRSRPEYAIRLANEHVWDSQSGLNHLGKVTLE